MRGGKHGGEVGSVGHAHRARSVRSATRVIYPQTADVFRFFFSPISFARYQFLASLENKPSLVVSQCIQAATFTLSFIQS